MSGRHAMSVRLTEGAVEHCDKHLSDVCLAFAETLVRMAAGVIAGVKPSAIFSIPMRAYCVGKWRQLERRAVDEALCAYARALPAYGVSLAVLHRTDRRVYLMVWRPQSMERVLGEPESAAILSEAGYGEASAERQLSELRRRLAAYYRRDEGVEFPHEIGIFLGYPPEDVRGFLAGEEATCVGPWRAYGDVATAQRRFEALERHERQCRRRFARGESLDALFTRERVA